MFPESKGAAQLTAVFGWLCLRMPKVIKQVDQMMELVAKHGHKPDIVCPRYAQAERDGVVRRKSNKHEISAEEYARRLYRDGERKGWL